MPSRLQRSLRASFSSKTRVYLDDKQAEENSPSMLPRPTTDTSSSRSSKSLSVACPRAMKSMKQLASSDKADSKYSSSIQRSSTIRTVSSFDYGSESSSTSPRNSAFSSSVNSNASGISYTSQNRAMHNGSTTSLKGKSPNSSPRPQSRTPIADAESRGHLTDREVTPRTKSMPYSYENSSPGLTLRVADNDALRSGARESSPSGYNWDSTGNAGLGKTGRVINKLVSDNDALKRDMRIEKLRADESKQAAKLLEDKMERVISDYESRLLEANVTKTLLSRKERQVESLHEAVEVEKKRTQDALDRERGWKAEMESMRRATSSQVQEAQSYAALMEGRYNAISSHWKDQGNEVNRTVEGLQVRISDLVHERKRDDEKISALRDLCDQQDGNIRDVIRQKEAITKMFEAYKKEQEEQLREIKRAAEERESMQIATIEESTRVLEQLRWALNVKKNLREDE